MKTVEVIVSGRVQRVGFRACVRKLAVSLTVGGMVMNLPDGRVRIVASAEDIILEKFISSLYGCPRAVVRDVVVTPREYTEATYPLRDARQSLGDPKLRGKQPRLHGVHGGRRAVRDPEFFHYAPDVGLDGVLAKP